MGGHASSTCSHSNRSPARAREDSQQAVRSALGEAHRLGIIHRDDEAGGRAVRDEAGVTRLSTPGVAHLQRSLRHRDRGRLGMLGLHEPGRREGPSRVVRTRSSGVGAMLWEMLTETNW